MTKTKEEQNNNVVFDKHWFQKHQSKLLWLSNSFLGEYIFQFKKMGHHLDPKKRITKITPYSVAQFNRIVKTKIGKEYEYTEHFFGQNKYAQKLYFILLPIWYAMHIWDWFVADHFQLAPQLSFGFSTLTKWPGSTGTNNPTDGYLIRDADNSTWAGVRDGAGTYKDDSGIGMSVLVLSGTNNSTWRAIGRSIFCFDTSGLTSSAVISSAVLSLYGTNKSDSFTYPATPNINIYASTPASTSSLVTGDFTQVGSTALCDTPITYAGFTTTGYNNFTLNAAGRSNISLTGISKFGARNANYDVANSAPYHPAAGQQVASLSFYTSKSDFTGIGGTPTSGDPKLVVTYTLPDLETASFSASSILATIPAIVASFAIALTAVFSPVPVRATVPAITATHDIFIVNFSPVSIHITNPTTTAKLQMPATFSPVSLKLTIPLINASNEGKFYAIYSSIALKITQPTFFPTYQMFAHFSPASILFSQPLITPKHLLGNVDAFFPSPYLSLLAPNQTPKFRYKEGLNSNSFTKESLQDNSFTKEPLQTNTFSKEGLQTNSFTKEGLSGNSFIKEPLNNI
jgi:hypothetical protein